MYLEYQQMRTYFFQDYQNMKHGKFIPSITFEAEEFGRHFFIDGSFDFISAASLKNGGYDKFLVVDCEIYDRFNYDSLDLFKIFAKYRI